MYGLKFDAQTAGDQFDKSNLLSMAEDILLKTPGRILFNVVLYVALLALLERIFFPHSQRLTEEMRRQQERDDREYIGNFVENVFACIVRRHQLAEQRVDWTRHIAAAVQNMSK